MPATIAKAPPIPSGAARYTAATSATKTISTAVDGRMG